MGICMKFMRVRKKTRGLMGIRAQVCASKAIYPEKVPNRSHFPLDYFLQFHQYRMFVTAGPCLNRSSIFRQY